MNEELITTTVEMEQTSPSSSESEETNLLQEKKAANETNYKFIPALPATGGNGKPPEQEAVLAVVCFEGPESAIGQQVLKTINALAARHNRVHLFSQQRFPSAAAEVQQHTVGACREDDLLAQAQEFGKRACNKFLQVFPGNCDKVTLLGYDWWAVPALSMLRGIKNVRSILSMHSVEWQRSDMTGDMSRQIAEIELTGMREAKTVLTYDQTTVDIIKMRMPECAERLVSANQAFPVHHFQKELDAGEIKARYQVGPVDPTILYVGDLDEKYGPDVLVKAMPTVLRNNQQARLIVVGGGELYWPLRVYTRYLLLEHAVRIVGDVNGQELFELIQACDLLVVPSRDATPWWPIQAAWAARRPVVATHMAAPRLLEHEQNSILVYPNENSCVWGIEQVLFRPELAKTIADNGRKKVEELFGWNGPAGQLEELMKMEAASVVSAE